jgi:acetamidase/formamidase
MACHALPATPETVRVGLIDRAHPPVLAVDAGDEVVVETWNHWADAVTPSTTLEDVIRYRTEVYPGRGPHSVTGPIEVVGARPGDVLRVDILDLVIRGHGYNLNLPGSYGMGLLPEDFPDGAIRHFVLDRATMTTEFAPGIRLPLAPFLGIMGVAPAEPGPHSSVPPGDFGGNIDLADLTAGTTLFLPVFVDGARFYAGDAHACQGDGEVNLTAIETAMSEARLRLSLADGPAIERPRAETAEHLITLAFDQDLDVAAKVAVRDMVRWLGDDWKLSACDAYALCSLAVDLSVTQVVNKNRGIHAKLPKAIFS